MGGRGFFAGVGLLLFGVAATAAPLRLTLLPMPGFETAPCSLELSDDPIFVPQFRGVSSKRVRGSDGTRGEAYFVDSSDVPHYLERVQGPTHAEAQSFRAAAREESQGSLVRLEVSRTLLAAARMIDGEERGELLRMNFPLLENSPAALQKPIPFFTPSNVAAYGAMGIMSVKDNPLYLLTFPVALVVMIREWLDVLQFKLGIPKASVRENARILVYFPDSTPGYGVLSFFPLPFPGHEPHPGNRGFVVVKAENPSRDQ